MNEKGIEKEIEIVLVIVNSIQIIIQNQDRLEDLESIETGIERVNIMVHHHTECRCRCIMVLAQGLEDGVDGEEGRASSGRGGYRMERRNGCDRRRDREIIKEEDMMVEWIENVEEKEGTDEIEGIEMIQGRDIEDVIEREEIEDIKEDQQDTIVMMKVIA